MARRPTILLVEEDENIQAFMAEALQGAGYRVIGAVDPNEGWTWAVQEQPECLIIDAILPGRSGFELCRQIRTWDPDHQLAIILVGLNDSPADRTWSLRQGADVYLPKPFTQALLVQVVSKLVAAPAQDPAPQQRQSQEDMHRASQGSFPAWWSLVPHRLEDPDLLKAVNPFSGAQVIEDKQARRLYTAIDGQKTLRELALSVNLQQKELIKALRSLFLQKRIRLVTQDGQLADGAWIFDQRLG